MVDSGPDHQKVFHAVVRVAGRDLGTGQGRSKKAAEQQAAEAAWRALSAEADGDGTGRAAPPVENEPARAEASIPVQSASQESASPQGGAGEQ